MIIEERPPQPRKLPQQERSRRMVTAIIDSCKKILMEQGEQALSLSLLESVSGVTKGSIYQYFPNMSAIVAALYKRECRLSIAHGLVVVGVEQHSLVKLLEDIIDKSIVTQKRLRELHTAFYSRYNLFYDLSDTFDQHEDSRAWARDKLTPLIEKYVGDEVLIDPIKTAFLTLETLKAQFWAPKRYDPSSIYTDAFRQQLIASALRVVDNAPRKVSSPKPN